MMMRAAFYNLNGVQTRVESRKHTSPCENNPIRSIYTDVFFDFILRREETYTALEKYK